MSDLTAVTSRNRTMATSAGQKPAGKPAAGAAGGAALDGAFAALLGTASDGQTATLATLAPDQKAECAIPVGLDGKFAGKSGGQGNPMQVPGVAPIPAPAEGTDDMPEGPFVPVMDQIFPAVREPIILPRAAATVAATQNAAQAVASDPAQASLVDASAEPGAPDEQTDRDETNTSAIAGTEADATEPGVTAQAVAAESIAQAVTPAILAPVQKRTEGKATASARIASALSPARPAQDRAAQAGAPASGKQALTGKANETAISAVSQGPVSTASSAATAPAGPLSANPAAPAGIQGHAAAEDGNGQSGNGRGGNDSGQGERRSSDRAGVLAAGQALPDRPAASETRLPDALSDIMRDLPPVVQAQLSTPGAEIQATGATASPSTGDLLGSRAIDMSISGQWIDRMAREITALAEGTGHSRFQLSPPNLGRIQVDLWRDDSKMNLRLLTETDEAAQRLRDGQDNLQAHARLASLSLGSVSVEKSSATFESKDQGQNPNQNPNQRQADTGGNAQQQASAQAQGQAGQGRRQSPANVGATSAVMGQDDQAEPGQAARAQRASDPHVRFA